ncbi:hypothetical protein HJA93_10195 [Rhizobium binae]|nr:hypothetical protein [Rhizobium binae]MBX4967830.1 hypothetical protein [Rhizobium binae]
MPDPGYGVYPGANADRIYTFDVFNRSQDTVVIDLGWILAGLDPRAVKQGEDAITGMIVVPIERDDW